MSDENRRKLKLLPEILPDPTLAKERATGPRDRALTHMQRLFATAAAATTVAGCGDKGDQARPEPERSSAPVTTATATATATASALTQKDPVPPVSATAEASAKPGTDPLDLRDAGDDAGVKKPPVRPPPPPPTHYMVVDPVPTPYRNQGSGSGNPGLP